jgi:hypothetical protein
VGRFRLRFEIEKYRNRYRYFYKHFGPGGARNIRLASLTWFRVRQIGWSLVRLVKNDEAVKNRLETYRVVADWNRGLDPVCFVEKGREPTLSIPAMN